MTSVRLKPATPRSRVKHSTTEPLRSTMGATTYEISTADLFYSLIVFVQEFFENSRPQKKYEILTQHVVLIEFYPAVCVQAIMILI